MITEHALPKSLCRSGQPLRVLIVGAGGAAETLNSSPRQLRRRSPNSLPRQLSVYRVDGRAHLWLEDLHIDVRCCRDLRVSHHALNALDMAFRQGRDGAADDLKRQLRQFQFLSQFVRYTCSSSVRLQPLGHLSAKQRLAWTTRKMNRHLRGHVADSLNLPENAALCIT